MKSSIKHIIAFAVVVVIFSSYTSGIQMKARIIQDLEKNWEQMFTDPKRTTLNCKDKPKVEITKEEEEMAKEKAMTEGVNANLPRKKPNYYEKTMIGWGPSAYLFDYLDTRLEKEVTSQFKQIWEEALKIVVDPHYKDPYSLDSMSGINSTNDDDKIKKLLDLTKREDKTSSFNPVIWGNSLSCAQMDAILKQWKWFANKSVPDPAKFIVDKFDYNGDGRLSAKEFIIAMIRTNKNIAVNGECKYCMEDVIRNYIDPIFMYLDCQNEEKINSEAMWTGLKQLDRKSEQNAFNFYKCDYNGGGFRTSAVNDFIIKAQKSMEGFLNKSEFRLGILQGYWSRHVDDSIVYTNCKMNMKDNRWDLKGTTDKVCEYLKTGAIWKDSNESKRKAGERPPSICDDPK